MHLPIAHQQATLKLKIENGTADWSTWAQCPLSDSVSTRYNSGLIEAYVLTLHQPMPGFNSFTLSWCHMASNKKPYMRQCHKLLCLCLAAAQSLEYKSTAGDEVEDLWALLAYVKVGMVGG